MTSTKVVRSILVFSVLFLLPLTSVYAVPSFTRQTGMECTACHTVFPELTKVGRDFKLQGYTQAKETQAQSGTLQLTSLPPLSGMVIVSMTDLKKKEPDTQNGDVLFPDMLSVFFAGRLADKGGMFVQVTYTQPENHFTMDMADIRYATISRNLVWGLTLNNNPTGQDVWNSVPAWGFPFASSGIAPTPAASTQIDHTLAQKVAGLGAYAYWNDLVYAEVSAYRSAQIGGSEPPVSSPTDTVGASTNIIDGVAPYWRVALEKNVGNSSFELGTYGLLIKTFPGGGLPLSGPADRFLDIAFDAQYQYVADRHLVTAHATWIHEDQKRHASSPAGLTSNDTDTLKTMKVNAIYYYNRTIGASLGYFNTRGSNDDTLYNTGAAVTGSINGSPDSSGEIVEVDYQPRQNIKLMAQYTLYDKFNGGRTDYDGAGRDASDNNTLFVAAWLMF